MRDAAALRIQRSRSHWRCWVTGKSRSSRLRSGGCSCGRVAPWRRRGCGAVRCSERRPGLAPIRSDLRHSHSNAMQCKQKAQVSSGRSEVKESSANGATVTLASLPGWPAAGGAVQLVDPASRRVAFARRTGSETGRGRRLGVGGRAEGCRGECAAERSGQRRRVSGRWQRRRRTMRLRRGGRRADARSAHPTHCSTEISGLICAVA